jgi:hypothetical protein
MKEYLRLLSQAVSSAQSIASSSFPDTTEAARHLLTSENERDRRLGLRKLRASKSPEAPNLALASYRFASSIKERMRAETCLATLSTRFPESTGDIAVAILHTQSRATNTFLRQSILRRSAANLTKVLQSGLVSSDDGYALDQLLTRWSRKAPKPNSRRGQDFLDDLSNPWLPTYEANEFKERHPDLFNVLNSRLQFTYALQPVSSEIADRLRVSLLQGLKPGSYADVVLSTVRPHLERQMVRKAMARLLGSWIDRFGYTSPESRRLQGILLGRRWGIVPPPQHFG